MYRKLFEDKDGRVVLIQKPNTAILVWLMSMIIVRLTHGTLQTRFQLLAFISLAAWAVMEILWGVNLFRRILGFGVVLVIVVTKVIN